MPPMQARPPAAPAPPMAPPPPSDQDAKRARTDFVLQAEDEFLEAHPGHSKVRVIGTPHVRPVTFPLVSTCQAPSPAASEVFTADSVQLLA